jgi:hypothetical protein
MVAQICGNIYPSEQECEAAIKQLTRISKKTGIHPLFGACRQLIKPGPPTSSV